MAQSSTRPAAEASITATPSPIEPGPIPGPQALGAASAFFNDFRAAMHDYPEEFVELEIVEVEFPGDVLNTSEEGSFRVQLTNNGLLDMTDVSLKVRGLNGTLVKTGGAADFDYRDELTIGMDSETIVGQGGVSLTQGSKLRFKAPASTKPAGTQLFKATIAGWNGSLVRILNGHSHAEDVAPAGTYSDQVEGQ
ncbi:MAG: hypothetical protein ACRD2Z_11355 [Thermoanaerobaculia bacterium]